MTESAALAPADTLKLTEEKVDRASSLTERVAQTALDEVKSFFIASDQQMITGKALLDRIKKAGRDTEAQRLDDVQDITRAVARMNAKYKPTATILKEAEKILKDKMSDYITEQHRVAAEERRKAEEAEEKERERLAKLKQNAIDRGDEKKAAEFEERAENVPVAVAAAPVVVPKGISTTETWKAEVFDEKAVYQGIIDGVYTSDVAPINVARLNEMARDQRETLDKPGIRAVKVAGISSRG